MTGFCMLLSSVELVKCLECVAVYVNACTIRMQVIFIDSMNVIFFLFI
jgi:hypothetical protein